MSIIYCRNYKTPAQKRRLAIKKIKQSNFEIARGIKEKTPDSHFPKNKGKCLVKDFFNVSGVYFLYKDNVIVYVGESGCIFGRIKQHMDDKDFDRFTYKIIDTVEMRKVEERKFIRKHRPKYNTIHNKDYEVKVPFIKI